ncbi:MAG: DUF4138 domain-containing protein [Bacteroidia bacterium]|nr:DUF4138 domain-containing protein [Bacteroidia bacterium]
MMEKFTIPDEKNLEIELFERRGGRHLKLTLRNKDLVGASLISGAGN